MAITAQTLIQPKYASVALNAEFFAPAKTIVDAFTVTNTSGGASPITVHVVPAGDLPSAGNCIVQSRIVAVGESYIAAPMLGHVLESGTELWCVAAAGNALVLFASGRVIA